MPTFAVWLVFSSVGSGERPNGPSPQPMPTPATSIGCNSLREKPAAMTELALSANPCHTDKASFWGRRDGCARAGLWLGVSGPGG
jgi:hypothetical protein